MCSTIAKRSTGGRKSSAIGFCKGWMGTVQLSYRPLIRARQADVNRNFGIIVAGINGHNPGDAGPDFFSEQAREKAEEDQAREQDNERHFAPQVRGIDNRSPLFGELSV